MNKFFGNFNNINDVESSFGVNLEGKNVLFAEYNTESYEGYAWVIYYEAGKLYEVHGSHCSCNGLEGQWSPEDTTAEVIVERIDRGGHHNFSTDSVKEILSSSLNLFFDLDNLPNPLELKKMLGFEQLIKDKNFLEDQDKQIKNIQQNIIETIKNSIVQNIEIFNFSTKINMSSKAKSLMEYHTKDIHQQVSALFKQTHETLKNKGYHNEFIINNNITELKCEFKVQLNNTSKPKKVYPK